LPGRAAGWHARSIDVQPPSSTPAATRSAAAILAVTALGAVFMVAWAAAGRPVPAAGGLAGWVAPLVTVVSYGVAGAVLVDRRPDLPFGWLLGGVAVLVAGHAALAWPLQAQGTPPGWIAAADGVAFLPVAVQGLVNVRFPQGRPASRWGAALEVGIVAGTVLVLIGGPLTALAPVVVLLGLVAGLGVVWRCVRARGIARQQLKWRAAGVLVALALFPLAASERLSFASAVDAPLFVLTLALPVLRYRLWAIDTIVRRSAAYAVVTAVLVAGYLGVAAAVAQVASARVAAPVAAVVVAMCFAPLRQRVQRLVDRLFYGDRADPYRTLRELGRQARTGARGDLLGALVRTVATSLRLPYAAVESPGGAVLAEHGARGARVERWALEYDRRAAGTLLASPRRGEDGFDERDRDVLAGIAGHLGVVVHADGLTAELLASRERLVTAREEERRRLRRDLHDGLGPVLTAVGLNLDAARSKLAGDPLGADRHVAEAKEAAAQALADVRRVAHALRPPALDDLGLVGALRAQAQRLGAGSAVEVDVEVGPLPDLPAAVEVAVFRVAVEAVTNAVRHSGGRRCRVAIAAAGGELSLRVHDDGPGRGPWAAGVGLTAMHERVDELGGALHAGPDPGGGATVAATLPLPKGLP
jgi:two-component system NarL family sensor kinase